MNTTGIRRFAAAAGLLLCGLAAGTASGQENQTFPFTGVVSGDSVNIRSGAGDSYYPVVQLDRGAIVEVHDNLHGWYRISAPPGTFSYIAKQYVNLAADGKSGLVSGNKVRVRAPSAGGPDKSYKIQMFLDEGAKVEILGEEADHYKIKPPDAARLFVKGDFIKPATAEQIAAWKAKIAAQPAQPTTPAPPTTPTTPTTPTPAQPAQPTTPTPALPTTPSQPTTPTPAQPTDTPPTVEPVKPVEPPVTPELPEGDRVVVTVLEDGSAMFDEHVVAPDLVAERFQQLVQEKPQAGVLIRSSAGVKLSVVTQIVDAARNAGVRNMAFHMPDDVKSAIDETVARPVPPVVPVDPFVAVEQRYAASAKKPLQEQPLEEMAAEYTRLLDEGKLVESDQTIAKLRLEQIQRKIENKKAQETIAALRAEIAKQKEKEIEEAGKRPKQYTAVGRLMASTLYTGKKLPLLHRLVDPLSGLTISYVKPSVEQDLSGYLGQYVGVVGDSRYDAALKLDVITPKEVDVLKASR